MDYRKIKYTAAVVMFIIIFTGCSGSGSKDELESYAESGEEINQNEIRYSYLTSINLKKDNATLRIYMPDGDSIEKSDSKARSTLQGIGVETELVKDDSEISVSGLSETEQNSRQNTVSQLPGVQDISVSAESTGESFSIRQINYSINDGNGNIFPCTVIIKADHIQSIYYLKTVITIDNSSAGDDSGSILKETLDAYGIKLGQ